MFPLKEKILIRGVNEHLKSGLGAGADYKAVFTELYLPFDGKIEQYSGKQGGKWLRLVRDNGDKLEFAHLSKYLLPNNTFGKEGQLCAITGNSGEVTTGPHLHCQIINKDKVRLDPEKYDWTKKKLLELRVSILLNHKPWPSLIKHLANYENWFWEASGGKIKLTAIPLYTNVKSPKKVFTGSSIGGYNVEVIEEKWFDEFIMPLRFPDSDIVIFNMERKDWTGQVFDHPELMEQGYCYAKVGMTYPIKAFTVHDEHDDYSPYYKNLGAFTKTLAHETLHGLYQIIPNDKIVPNGDYTHRHFYGEVGDPVRPEDCFKDFSL